MGHVWLTIGAVVLSKDIVGALDGAAWQAYSTFRGHPIAMAGVRAYLKIIARESPQPLAGEFQRLVENLAMGVTVEQGLEKMYERMPTSELRFFTIVLAIQSKTGGNLAEALANLSTVLRARKLMREKIKALSSEAIASASIIGAMPPGVMTMVMLTTPSYMMMMFTDKRGNVMLLFAVFWMSLGIFVMRRMINFKF